MQNHHHQHRPQPHIHPSQALVAVPSDFELKRGKKQRGSYNCGRCGQPKKGHNCNLPPTPNAAVTAATTLTTTPTASDLSVGGTASSLSAIRPSCAPSRPSYTHLRRALSFDDIEVQSESPSDGEFDPTVIDTDLDLDSCSGGLPVECLWEVLRRLPPVGLLSAAKVCKGWRNTTRRMWKAAEELRLRVPLGTQLGLVGSMLQKCPGLLRLTLIMESDLDATMLACIAFSCPNLESLEITMSDAAVNRITGDELARFVADKRCLTSLKMEGCSNFGGFVFCSSSLSTLWLSSLHSMSKMVINCPNLIEISLQFSRQDKDSTELTRMIDGLGRTCQRLQNIHISSVCISHAAVLTLAAANFRELRMLSLVLGSGITDASVAAIASSYSKLELLDLSGSSISDSGLGIICNVFPDTLSRLLLALCPNITSSGIQFATAQLPLLELMDCGMTISDPNSEDLNSDESSDSELQKQLSNKLHHIYQKLIIKHSRLKKLSLWGCSGLDALYLNCPELNDLNLNSCRNLHPDRLLLQCSNLESIHASGCQEFLIEAIQTQANKNFAAVENHFPSKRLADGSKRVQVPYSLYQQTSDDNKKRKRVEIRQCNVVVE